MRPKMFSYGFVEYFISNPDVSSPKQGFKKARQDVSCKNNIFSYFLLPLTHPVITEFITKFSGLGIRSWANEQFAQKMLAKKI